MGWVGAPGWADEGCGGLGGVETWGLLDGVVRSGHVVLLEERTIEARRGLCMESVEDRGS